MKKLKIKKRVCRRCNKEYISSFMRSMVCPKCSKRKWVSKKQE